MVKDLGAQYGVPGLNHDNFSTFLMHLLPHGHCFIRDFIPAIYSCYIVLLQ